MKNSMLLLTAFVLICGVQLYVPASMILEMENVVKTGVEYKFKTAPVDPTDPFRGKYVTLRFDNNDIRVEDTTTNWYFYKEVFVQVTNDADGFAKIADVSVDPFDNKTDYFKAWIHSTYVSNGQTELTINYPFNRYYMEESKAPEAEKAYAQVQWDTSRVAYALVNVKKGKAVLKDVLIDGIPIKEYVQKPGE